MRAVRPGELHMALHWHWAFNSGPYAQQVPMIIEAGAASVITVTARSPFGETERSARRWLPYLRLLAAIALTGLAILALQLGAVGENLNDGIAVLAWNVIGFTGLGLPCSLITVARSPGRSPRDNTTFCQYALLEAWTAPVDLAVGPPADRGAWTCASLVFAVGLLLFTVLGPAPASATTVRGNPLSCTADGADPRCHLGHRKRWPTARLGRKQRSVKPSPRPCRATSCFAGPGTLSEQGRPAYCNGQSVRPSASSSSPSQPIRTAARARAVNGTCCAR